jgi:ketosteroid isomerase-like protein
MTTNSSQTEAILGHHMESFATKDLDALMSDYVESSVLITAEKTYTGIAEIRTFFDAMLKGVTPEFLAAFKMVKQEIVGDVAYINFTVEGFLTLGSDTLVMKDGKIAVQVFTAQPAG